MPNTRKKVIKTVYKDDCSDEESGAGDFSDSGSEAQISDEPSSEDEYIESDVSSGQEFNQRPKGKLKVTTLKPPIIRRKKFAKELISKINQSSADCDDNEGTDVTPALFSVKDLTDADKLLPSVLNLSESDSSDDEPSKPKTKTSTVITRPIQSSDSEDEIKIEYKDVWAQNIKDSEEVAKRAFMELEKHKSKIEEAKESIFNYTANVTNEQVSDVKDLLALGEKVLPETSSTKHPPKKTRKSKKQQDDSDSEMEDWEEVKEAKGIPQEGIQLVVGIPDECRKAKKLDIEMMMKRKINRVKKEQQVFMHKVHVLCWIGHGNYVSRVLNDEDIMAAALSLVPSKECYPGERVDMKYVEQITTWYKDKFTLKQDKNEDKFRPKAAPLKTILLEQMKSRKAATKKYLVYIFVSMLRAIGLKCRVMFNFITLPLKPPTSELCSLSTKPKVDKTTNKEKSEGKSKVSKNPKENSKSKSKTKIPQIDGIFDESSSDSDFENIMQLDGNDDAKPKTRSLRTVKTKANIEKSSKENDDVSPPKRARKSLSPKPMKKDCKDNEKFSKHQKDAEKKQTAVKKSGATSSDKITNNDNVNIKTTSVKLNNFAINASSDVEMKDISKSISPRKTRHGSKTASNESNKNNSKVETEGSKTASKETNKNNTKSKTELDKKDNLPKIVVTKPESDTSKYFNSKGSDKAQNLGLSRTRSKTTNPPCDKNVNKNVKSRTKSAYGTDVKKSKYFADSSSKSGASPAEKQSKRITKPTKKDDNAQRVSHRDLAKPKTKPKNDITNDLKGIVKKRIKEAKDNSKLGIVKGRETRESDADSDFLPEEDPKGNSGSDDDFKPTKISPKPRPSTSKRSIDRRVLSSDEETPQNKTNVWCEVFVEELEQWVAVDVIRGKAHCTNEIYSRATHPVCYVVGWDNNNYLKDLTRRYVPHWNTMTRKQRAEPSWWETAIRPWLGPRNAREREEDEQLNRMQMDAPLPKSISEYKNHPLYALSRHLLKFEALYPPAPAPLGYVRNEPVYSRDCVYVCRSRDIWLKEAKVVRLGEKPYKIVKARPKWDKLSNKVIKDKLLELFGPWQTQDYEPPVAENGIVPRNAYGNVELFKPCMLPKGTAHVKLPGLNRVAKKLNIDCAPAMTGFDFNGGWSHPVYDGFVVCKEYEEIITEAWVKDQEEQERRETEKLEARVYGNWRRLIKGLLIRERLKDKYGFEEPSTSQEKKTAKGPRYVAKKTH